MREHPAHLVLAIRLPFLAVVVGVRPERRRDGAGRLDAADEVGIDQRAVLDAVPTVGMWPFLEHALVGVQHHVDRDIAVGVNADLPIVAVRILDRLVQLLLVHRRNAVVIWLADVRRAHAHRPLGSRAVGHELHGSDTHEVIAETGMDTRVAQVLECSPAAVADGEDIGAMQELAFRIRVLVRTDLIGIGRGVMHRGQPRLGQPLRHERGRLAATFLQLRAGKRLVSADVVEHLARQFRDLPLQLAAVVLEVAPVGGIGRAAGDTGELERLAVEPARVAAAVIDADRSIGAHRIEILASQCATVGELRVIELEATDPVTGLGVGGALLERLLDLGDAAQVDVDVVEFLRLARMAMRIDEPGRHSEFRRVDDRRVAGGERLHVRARADRDEAPVLHREGLGMWRGIVHCQHVAVDEH